MQRNEAPGELELVRRFVNTRDIEDGSEELHSPDALLTWFAAVDLLDDEAAADEKDLERALTLREGIRALLLANNGEETETVRIRDLNRAIGSVYLTVRFDDNGGATLKPESAVCPRPLVASLPQWCGPWTREAGAG
jgi:Putative stress-induced transcription regulator